MTYTVVVLGGGAAGFFGALACKEQNPHLRVIIVEKTSSLLAKVRVSGGGRCNVTHHCFDIKRLVKSYPRGEHELQQAFHQFQPQDTVQWFKDRGVILKTEADGRMFPITDSSETIIQCFLNEAQRLGVEIMTQAEVVSILKHNDGFEVCFDKKASLYCHGLLVASGSNKKAFSLIESLGHTIESPVPSLFTFTLPQSPLLPLAGVSVSDVEISCEGISQRGAVLVTHWGLSGPCVLKLSAWAARQLFQKNYKAEITINWLPSQNQENILEAIEKARMEKGAKSVASENPFSLPKSLWRLFIDGVEDKRWSTLSKKEAHELARKLMKDKRFIDGKTTYKDEFVTCGGARLKEINFKTMESKLVPGLYFAGEVLDIDGITGGFNFQSAWTTGWIAGRCLAAKLVAQ